MEAIMDGGSNPPSSTIFMNWNSKLEEELKKDKIGTIKKIVPDIISIGYGKNSEFIDLKLVGHVLNYCKNKDFSNYYLNNLIEFLETINGSKRNIILENSFIDKSFGEILIYMINHNIKSM